VIDRRELKSGEQVYYFVLHRYRDPATGKLRTRKCAIGSEGYIYVTKTHTLPYHGVSLHLSNVVEAEKLAELALRAVENVERYLRRTRNREKLREEVAKLQPIVAKLLEQTRRLESLVSKIGNTKVEAEAEV